MNRFSEDFKPRTWKKWTLLSGGVLARASAITLYCCSHLSFLFIGISLGISVWGIAPSLVGVLYGFSLIVSARAGALVLYELAKKALKSMKNKK